MNAVALKIIFFAFLVAEAVLCICLYSKAVCSKKSASPYWLKSEASSCFLLFVGGLLVFCGYYFHYCIE